MKKTITKFLKAVGLFDVAKRAKLWREARTNGLMAHYFQFIKRGDLVFDVGANNGNRTEIFLGLGARVVAVEPQISCGTILAKEFGDNKKFTLIAKALGAKQGIGEIALCDDTTVTATMSEAFQKDGRFSDKYTWSKKQAVEITTLDALIDVYGTPAFCKIDVEGFEEEVFKGLSKSIPMLSFEFTKESFDGSKRSVAHLSKIASAHGKKISFSFSLAEDHKLALDRWVSEVQLFSILDALGADDADLWGDIYVRMQ